MHSVRVEELGLNAEKLGRVEDWLKTYVDQGKIGGAVTLVARRGQIAQLLAVGRMDIETDSPMEPDTIFRIYSLTKIVTSVAILMLYDEGRIQLDDPIARYIPPFADVKVFAGKEDGEIKLEELRRPITIRHLLTHTAGIGHDALFGSPLASVYRKAELARPDQTLEEMVERLVQLPLLHQPGEGWNYSISTDVLARLVEVVSGRRFDEFLRERIFEPLDMVDTGFWVPDYDLHRLATVYSVERNGRLKAVDTAVSSPYSRERTYLSGSAGLASTPIDFYRFAQMLLSGGEWGGVRILQPETVALMTRNHLPESLLPYRMPWRHVQHYTDGCGFGLGVRVVLDLEAWGLPGSVGEYGWAGATNTYVWIDPVQEMVLLLFTQLVPFMHWPLDREFKRLVYEAIEQ